MCIPQPGWPIPRVTLLRHAAAVRRTLPPTRCCRHFVGRAFLRCLCRQDAGSTLGFMESLQNLDAVRWDHEPGLARSAGVATMQDVYSADGALTQRVWKKSDCTTNRTQTLSWDAKGRLFKVTERDDQNSGYNWEKMVFERPKEIRPMPTPNAMAVA